MLFEKLILCPRSRERGRALHSVHFSASVSAGAWRGIEGGMSAEGQFVFLFTSLFYFSFKKGAVAENVLIREKSDLDDPLNGQHLRVIAMEVGKH